MRSLEQQEDVWAGRVCVSARLPAGNELESTTGRVCDVIVL